MQNIKKALDKVLGSICMILFSLMTIIALYQVITRYVFRAPSSYSEELLTYLFTWLALFAAAYVFGKRDHMKMSFFVERFSLKTQATIEIVIEALIFVFALMILLFGGINIASLTMTQTSASLGIPMGTIYLALPISGVLIMFYSLFNFIDLIQKRDKPEILAVELKKEELL